MSIRSLGLVRWGVCALLMAEGLVSAQQPGVSPSPMPDPKPPPAVTPSPMADAKPPAAAATHPAAEVKPPAAGPVSSTEAKLPPAAEPGAVREVKPETFLLPNKEGTLVPVLNLPFEEFERLMRLEGRSGGSAPALPAYSLEELAIRGQVQGLHAELGVSVRVRLQREGWVKVPLRFAGATLREPAKCSGEGGFVTYEDDASGYAAWLRAAPDKTCEMSLKLAIAVQHFGNETRLTLPVPRATTARLLLRVDVPDATATVNGGLLEVLKSDGGTQLQASGLAGDYQIAWRKAESRPVQAGPLLAVRCDSQIRIESLRQVTGDLRLKVNSLSGDFDSLAIRLPPGTRLLPRPVSGYQLTETKAADPPEAKRVQVRLERRTPGPVEVTLFTELAPLANGKSAEFEVGGVEVEDAVRQTGAIEVPARGDWFVTWKPGPNVQRVVPDPSRPKVAARFEYTQRPSSLRMQVAAKETQTHVEPTYVLHVYPDQVRLEAALKYRLRGSKTPGVNIELPDWHVTGVGPEPLVAQESLDSSSVSPLYIPLTALAQTETGEFTLRVEAFQDIASDTTAWALKLPRPVATTQTPATIAVLPADNVELTVAETALQGLDRHSAAPNLELPARQQTPLYFRERSDAAVSVFAATRRVRQRAVSASLAHHVRLDARRARVEQQVRYRIAYEPLRRIALEGPRAVFESPAFKVLHGDEALPLLTGKSPAAVGDAPADAAANPADRVVREFDLLADRIGDCDITVHYSLPIGPLTSSGETTVGIPLVLPAVADKVSVTAQTLQLVTDRLVQFRVGEAEGVWEPVEPGDEPAGTPDGGVHLVCREPSAVPGQSAAAVQLLLRRADRPQRGNTQVSQAWVQTWRERHKSRERVVFRMTTQEDRLPFQLPAWAVLEDIALDGYRIPSADSADPQVVVVDFPEEDPPAEHVVEIWCTREDGGAASGEVRLEPVTIAGLPPVRRWYWQIVVPADEYLLAASAGLTPEFTWAWRGWGWRRESALDQPELERWIGASRQEPLPAAVNRYLFGSFGPMTAVTVTVVDRFVLLCVASGCALLLGLALLYIRLLRHPAVLFGTGVVVLAGVAWRPDLSFAIVQAALLGLALAVAGHVLNAFVEARQARRTIVRGTASGIPESRTVLALPGRGSSVVTATAGPAASNLPAAEQQP